MNIAIVRLSSLGDIIHSAVVLQFIKKRFPESRIDWFCEELYVSLLENNPHIDSIRGVNLRRVKKEKNLLSLIAELKKLRNTHGYDIVIDMQGLIKSAIVARLVSRNVSGFDRKSAREGIGALFYKYGFNIPYEMNTIDRNCLLVAKSLGISITSDDILNKEPFLFYEGGAFTFDNLLSKDKKNVVFIIGSTWDSRNYPKEKFARLADLLEQHCLIVWASEGEKKRAEDIASLSGHAVVLPKLSLNDLKALIDKTDLVIGNDAGPTHIAWAMNTPSITIFGPTPTSRVYITKINKVVKSPSSVTPSKLNKSDFSIQEISENDI
ncbi:MAG: lipopolysaccharide heptosyltransferase I, partial [Pseudomonadota bacterium]